MLKGLVQPVMRAPLKKTIYIYLLKTFEYLIPIVHYILISVIFIGFFA